MSRMAFPGADLAIAAAVLTAALGAPPGALAPPGKAGPETAAAPEAASPLPAALAERTIRTEPVPGPTAPAPERAKPPGTLAGSSPRGSEGSGDSGGSGGSGGPSAGWGRPVLVDHFNGTRLDRRKWVVYHSPDAQVNPRTGKATSVRGGMLRLTGGFYGGKDLSGGVATRLAQRYGRWEVRLRAEKGAGYTPVALLWPQRQGTPDYAEVDFAEIIDPTRRSGGIFVHRGEAPQAQRQMRADFTEWRTVAVEWLPGRLTFWLDGRKVWTYTGRLVPQDHRMHLALQNDVVCNQWSPCRNAATPPTVTMYVDWVKVYRAG
jgi:hypothetical protein